jgi:hypothetical protein
LGPKGPTSAQRGRDGKGGVRGSRSTHVHAQPPQTTSPRNGGAKNCARACVGGEPRPGAGRAQPQPRAALLARFPVPPNTTPPAQRAFAPQPHWRASASQRATQRLHFSGARGRARTIHAPSTARSTQRSRASASRGRTAATAACTSSCTSATMRARLTGAHAQRDAHAHTSGRREARVEGGGLDMPTNARAEKSGGVSRPKHERMRRARAETGAERGGREMRNRKGPPPVHRQAGVRARSGDPQLGLHCSRHLGKKARHQHCVHVGHQRVHRAVWWGRQRSLVGGAEGGGDGRGTARVPKGLHGESEGQSGSGGAGGEGGAWRAITERCRRIIR